MKRVSMIVARTTNKKIILTVTLVIALSVFTARATLAEDTKTLVYKACTECHDAKKDPQTGKKYWEGVKKNKAEWGKIVDKMQMWGAQLTDQEADLVVNYLVAAGNGKIPKPTTTTTVKSQKTTTTKAGGANKAVKTSIATTTTTVPPTTTTLPPATIAPVSTSVLKEQAETGVEVIWYLLGGGSMLGSGMALRNRDKQLGMDDEADDE